MLQHSIANSIHLLGKVVLFIDQFILPTFMSFVLNLTYFLLVLFFNIIFTLQIYVCLHILANIVHEILVLQDATFSYCIWHSIVHINYYTYLRYLLFEDELILDQLIIVKIFVCYHFDAFVSDWLHLECTQLYLNDLWHYSK